MAKLTIVNKNTDEEVEYEGTHYQMQFLADLVSGSWAQRDWDYHSMDVYPERPKTLG